MVISINKSVGQSKKTDWPFIFFIFQAMIYLVFGATLSVAFAKLSLALSSNGQDIGFSSRQSGFDSP